MIKLVGAARFRQARELVDRGEVLPIAGTSSLGELRGRVIEDRASTTSLITRVTIDEAPDGSVVDLRGSCFCSDAEQCSHAVALALTRLSDRVPGASPEGRDHPGLPPSPSRPSPSKPSPSKPPAWERTLAPLLESAAPGDPAQSDAPSEAARIALQLEVLDGQRGGRYGHHVPKTRVGMRPVLRSDSGNWIRTGISWSNLSWVHVRGATETTARQLTLLRELLALRSNDAGYLSPSTGSLFLDEFPSGRVWDVLTEAQEAGLPLLQPGTLAGEVVLHGGGQVAMLASRTASGLHLRPRLSLSGEPDVPIDELVAIGPRGRPGHGIAWRSSDPATRATGRDLHLAALPRALAEQLATARGLGGVLIPARDEERFFGEYFPELSRRLRIVTDDQTIVLPEPGPPVLQLTITELPAVRDLPAPRAAVTWHWRYPVGSSERVHPLDPPSVPAGRAAPLDRDAAVEAAAQQAVLGALRALPFGPAGHELHPLRALVRQSGSSEHLAQSAELTGVGVIRLLTDAVPALSALPGVDVTVLGDLDPATYREALSAPVIAFSSGAGDGRAQDWFDLAVTVTIEGEPVPFNDLFLALARGESHLVLPSGTYFSLDVDRFRQLAALIEESRALEDAPPGAVRLGRFQAGLWEELDQLGVVTGQAAHWLAAVRELIDSPQVVDREPPVGLKATLRPYQLAGFNWLATLHANGLGGVLADDMGLGKTLQALALFCHLKEREAGREEGAGAPFLVVAPTSVAANWAGEAAQFAPDLRVQVVTETQARSGVALSELAGQVDVVVTSYALFRIEHDDYAALDWAGLVLDEAQFTKNHQSKAYQCARTLNAPFKLAITGTPMENNLMELWSLLSITAPGLFAQPARFTEYYRHPIEREHDVDRLAQLRRRVRPLMLRRTKDQVVRDLPDKQEQVLELELNAKHKRVYQAYLNRERQKVLGLIGDLNRNRFEIFRSLTLLRQASLDVGLVDPKHAAVPSTKLDAMMDHVTDLVAEGHRTLVFSQFTRFLTAARDRLDAAGIEYCYLDGTTRRRPDVIQRFRTGTAPVFLISLKAGGFGLNLTEADYCILLDPWWNPATEAQAVDRVHRIGQTKKVMVYRLVAKDTIEEKVMALKATKAALFASVMDDGGFESATLTASDIRGLLE